MTIRHLLDIAGSNEDDDRWLAAEREVLAVAWRELKPAHEQAVRERDKAMTALQRMRTRRATRAARAIDEPLRQTVRALRDVRRQIRPSTQTSQEATPPDLPTPNAFRHNFTDLLATPGALRVAVLGSDADAESTGRDGFASTIATAGWTVVTDARAADVLLVADPRHAIRGLARGPVLVALVGEHAAWRARNDMDAFDLVIVADLAAAAGLDGNVVVLAPEPRLNDEPPRGLEPAGAGARSSGAGPWSATALAHGLDRLLREWAAGIRIGISVGIPTWDVAETWGDLHFARAMQRAFVRRGHAARIHILPEWADRVAARDDVAIHVFGLSQRVRLAGQRTILWVISHPERVTPAMLSLADRTYVASSLAAERLARETDRPVGPLHQATDPQRFSIDRTGPPHEVLFVGNTRGVRRELIESLIPTTFDLAIYGRGWFTQYPRAAFVRGEHIANDDLHRWYGSAAVVLNDHWPDMREQGFFSNRIYDALAAGGFVISDIVPGLDEEFDGGVVGVSSPGELRWAIRRALADPRARARIAEEGHRAVLDRHTFSHRIERILADLSTDLGSPARPSLPAADET